MLNNIKYIIGSCLMVSVITAVMGAPALTLLALAGYGWVVVVVVPTLTDKLLDRCISLRVEGVPVTLTTAAELAKFGVAGGFATGTRVFVDEDNSSDAFLYHELTHVKRKSTMRISIAGLLSTAIALIAIAFVSSSYSIVAGIAMLPLAGVFTTGVSAYISQREEFLADAGACDAGYGEELIIELSTLPPSASKWYASHPSTSARIAALEG